MMTPLMLLRRLPPWVVNGASVTIGLALAQYSIGWLAGPHAAQTAIGAAVCASLADVVTTTGRVARRVLAASLASLAAGAAFLALRPHGELLIPGVAAIMFAAMLPLAWGPKAGAVSFAAALAMVFAMSLPASMPLDWERFGWAAAGSAGYWIWAVATSRLLQPLWRNVAIASAAASEARLLAAIARQLRTPTDALGQSGILDEEAALAERLQNAADLVFINDKGPAAARETAILLHLIDLRDLAMAGNLQAGLFAPESCIGRQGELKARIVAGMAAALDAVAAYLRSGAAPLMDLEAEAAIGAALAELEQASIANPGGDGPDSNTLLHSKLDLLRRLQRLLAPGCEVHLPCQRADLRRFVSPDEWRLGPVLSNLRPGSPVFRHALRTSVTAGAAYAIALHSPWTPHPQWVVLTIAAVMQGSLAQTLVRRNARIAGTLAGCLVVAVLTLYPVPLFLSACFLIAAGVAHAFFMVRYAVTAGAGAVMAVLQSFLAVPASGFGTIERVADTIVGAVFGWAATYLLPTWERKTLPSVLRRASAAMRAFALEATALRADAGGSPRFARQQAYDAIRAVSAIRTRSLMEPAHVRVPLQELTSWLSAAYGVMASLSNLRLTLTLYGREIDDPHFRAAMSAVSRAIGALLDDRMAEPGMPPTPGRELDAALAPVHHLAPRVRLALENAARVSRLRTQMQPCFAPGAGAGAAPAT